MLDVKPPTVCSFFFKKVEVVLDITTTNGSHEWNDEQIPGSVPEDITSSGSVLEDIRRRGAQSVKCFEKFQSEDITMPESVPEDILTKKDVSENVMT